MQKIKCLICGKSFIKPCSHIWQKHDMTSREYKKEFGLDLKKGLIPEDHRKMLHDNVFENGTVNNLKSGINTRFKKGHHFNYERSKQTLDRLREQGKKIAKLYPIKNK